MSFFSSEEWDDIEPVPVTEADNAVAQIRYTPDFSITMGYFRAILRLGEKSKRALELTERVIDGNAANYTAWFYRRECLFALKSDLNEELRFVTEKALNTPKNYQIWYHRREIVDRMGDPSKELEFVEYVLAGDSKNYHAWSYRQHILQHFNLWSQELDFVNRLLDDDLRNNSAWNQRWFVVKSTEGFAKEEVRTRELKFAFDLATKAPNNESAFNYIRGIMRVPEFKELELVCTRAESLAESLRSKYTSSEEPLSSANPPPLLALLVELYAATQKGDRATMLCEELATKHDTIRAKYWRYKAAKLVTAK